MSADRPIAVFVASCFVVGTFVPHFAEAAEAEAGSGFFAARKDIDTDSATWRFSDPDATDTIEWTSGPNETDGVMHPVNMFGPEGKANIFAPPPPLFGGRVFIGFADADSAGPLAPHSEAETSGSGSSAFLPGTLWGVNFRATWKVVATGALAAAPPRPPKWSSQATGDDPYHITRDQLDQIGVTGTSYDLFFPVALIGGEYSEMGSIQLEASYTTASGTTELLDILLQGTTALVTNDNPTGLTFFRLSDLSEGPTEVASNIISLSTVQAELDVDMDNMRLDNPLYLGIIWDDIPVPTVELSDGSLARLHVGLRVTDADVIPEPNSMLLFVSVLSLGVLVRRRRGFC